MTLDAAKRQALEGLRREPKFVEEPLPSIYNGMRPESDRLAAEQQLNGLIDLLIGASCGAPKRKVVLAAIARTLKDFSGSDSEDCDRMCRYMRQILDVLGIESSGGLLARWRYGWLLGTLMILPRGTRR
jgi:hypothetical protein